LKEKRKRRHEKESKENKRKLKLSKKQDESVRAVRNSKPPAKLPNHAGK
jgi:hypothetical protein